MDSYRRALGLFLVYLLIALAPIGVEAWRGQLGGHAASLAAHRSEAPSEHPS